MRILMLFEILEKTKSLKTNYSHETYSTIINNIHPKFVERFHIKNKDYRYLSFSNIYIKENKAHIYILGADEIIESLIKYVSAKMILKIGDMVVKVIKITPVDCLAEKQKYLFKTSLIVNISTDRRCVLCEEIDYIEKRLKEIAVNKAKKLGINKNEIDFEVINPVKRVTKYKSGHISSWKCFLKITGDYELVNFLYTTSGVGENTSTGHGMLWEVS